MTISAASVARNGPAARALPSRPCRRSASVTTAAEGQRHAVGREIDQAELLGQTNQQRADPRGSDRAHAAAADDHQRGEEITPVLARPARPTGPGAPITPENPAGAPPTATTPTNSSRTLTTAKDGITRSLTLPRIIMPTLVRLKPSLTTTPRSPLRRRARPADEAEAQEHRPPVRRERRYDGHSDGPSKPAEFRTYRSAAPHREREVGRGDREADGHQCLAQLVARGALQYQHLHQHADRR